MNEKPVIELTDVCFSYGSFEVLRDVNFTVGENQLVCVVGPNGGGKTTLLKIIVGLLQPDSGQARVFGGPPHQARNLIGYLPQSTNHDPSFPVSVLEVVLMGRLQKRLFGPYRKTDYKIARESLQEVDMADFVERPFAALSGGQRQRVLIARALATQPRLLILDEPTANIDPAQERCLHEILQRLRQRMTIVMVTHDFVSELVEEVVCVNRTIEVHPTSRVVGHGGAEPEGAAARVVRHDCKLGESDE